MKSVTNNIIDTNGELVLPHNLGMIWVKKKKMKIDKTKLKIDYFTTKKLGKVIYFLNEHTRNFSYKIQWMRKRSRVKGRDRYDFDPSRYLNRYLAVVLKDEFRTIDYCEKR
jgi:hypothetical protein